MSASSIRICLETAGGTRVERLRDAGNVTHIDDGQESSHLLWVHRRYAEC
jgi:hypothetical protein